MNKFCELIVDDYLYKIEFEKECDIILLVEIKVLVEIENYLLYILGFVCMVLIVVIIIVIFFVFKKKVGMLICL